MSLTSLILVFGGVICLLVFLLVVCRWHPVLAMFACALVAGIAVGNSPLGTIGLMTDGFGEILKSTGFPMLFSCMIAMGIQDTGATVSISRFFYRILHGKHLELVTACSSYVMSIPVYNDVTFILNAPIASTLALQSGRSMSSMSAFVTVGSCLSHSMVPPAPGILAVAVLLGANIGKVAGYAIAITVVSFFMTYLILRRWVGLESIKPAERYRVPARLDLSEISSNIAGEPPVLLAFLPILVPVLLIILSSFCTFFIPIPAVLAVTDLLGDKVVALGIGMLLSMLLAFHNRDAVLQNARENKEVPFQTSDQKRLGTVVANNWIERAVRTAAGVLFIMATGGAFGNILKTSPAIHELGSVIASMRMPAVLFVFLLTSALFAATGSMTVASMTTASICLPLMGQLGVSPEAAVLAIGCGSCTFNHVNSAAFWIVSREYNLNVRQGLKYFTLPCCISGFISFGLLMLLRLFGMLA